MGAVIRRRGCVAQPERRERRSAAVRRRAGLHARPVVGSFWLASAVGVDTGANWPAPVGAGQRRGDPRAGGAQQSRPQASLVERPSIRRGDGVAPFDGLRTPLRHAQDGAEP